MPPAPVHTALSGIELAAAIAQLLQVAVVIAAGVWAFYKYRLTRQSQLRMEIEASANIVRDWRPGLSVLLVKVRITNSSGVLYTHK